MSTGAALAKAKDGGHHLIEIDTEAKPPQGAAIRAGPLLDRREVEAGAPDRGRPRVRRAAVAEGRSLVGRREPLRSREHPPHAPPDGGAARAWALQARGRLHRQGRRGHHRRRVHGPHDDRPALVGRPAPGRRSEGGRARQGREPDRRLDHVPELLPHVQEARRHDGHGGHGSVRVPADLRPRGRRDPDAHADDPRRRAGPRLSDAEGQVRRDHRGHQGLPQLAGSPCSSARRRSRPRSSSRAC